MRANTIRLLDGVTATSYAVAPVTRFQLTRMRAPLRLSLTPFGRAISGDCGLKVVTRLRSAGMPASSNWATIRRRPLPGADRKRIRPRPPAVEPISWAAPLEVSSLKTTFWSAAGPPGSGARGCGPSR